MYIDLPDQRDEVQLLGEAAGQIINGAWRSRYKYFMISREQQTSKIETTPDKSSLYTFRPNPLPSSQSSQQQ